MLIKNIIYKKLPPSSAIKTLSSIINSRQLLSFVNYKSLKTIQKCTAETSTPLTPTIMCAHNLCHSHRRWSSHQRAGSFYVALWMLQDWKREIEKEKGERGKKHIIYGLQLNEFLFTLTFRLPRRCLRRRRWRRDNHFTTTGTVVQHNVAILTLIVVHRLVHHRRIVARRLQNDFPIKQAVVLTCFW